MNQPLPSESIVPERQCGPRVPLFSLSRRSSHQTDPTALAAYYADRSLMWRNVVFIGIANMGWGMALQILGPLIQLKLKSLGVGVNIQTTMSSVNNFVVAFLVMLFSWMSDHTISRMGRRKPYFFISAPFIILTLIVFPFFAIPRFVWFLLTMQVIYMLAMDLKASTFSLIMIDCVPREMLGRTDAVFGVVGGLTGFILGQKAGSLIALGPNVLFPLGGAVMVVTTLCALLVKEPPVYNPPTEAFKPWSTFKVAAVDKRLFVLMAGIVMVGAYGAVNGTVFWLWSDKLGLKPAEVFEATSWTSLLGIGLAYPMGWIMDRFGGLKLVTGFFVTEIVCYILTFYVHDKASLTVLVLAQAAGFPLYRAAYIILFKACPHKDVGSITSTNACLSNLFNFCLLLTTGWVIYWAGDNYRVGFTIGAVVSTIGMAMFLIYYWLMRTGPVVADEEHPAGSVQVPAQAAPGQAMAEASK